MDELNRVLGDEGAGFPVIACGKTYSLSRLTQAVKGQYSAWVVAQALRHAREARQSMTSRDYRETLGAINDRMLGGEYAWDAPLCRDMLITDEGAVALLRLLLALHHPKISEAKAKAILTDNPEGVKMAVEQLMGAVPNSAPPDAGKSVPGESEDDEEEALAASAP